MPHDRLRKVLPDLIDRAVTSMTLTRTIGIQATLLPRLCERYTWCCISLACLLVSVMSVPGYAAGPPITPSGLNTNVAGPISVNGKTQYDITGGTRPGGGTNLFHSFGDFNVPNNNVANFLNAGSADLAGNPLAAGLPTSNILGRVTGGNMSNIFGAIHTTNFGAANLFLMNPAGFLFGPNATVNVGGMVAFTSADYLRLADGVRFNAIPNPAADALLSIAPVAAFGFLGSNPGAITVQGSQFRVADGTGIALVGGNITVQNGTFDNGAVQPAKLSAPGGQITLGSVTGIGEVSATGALSGFDPAKATGQGTIQLTSRTTLQTSSSTGNAGPIVIRAGQFIMENAALEAKSSFSAPTLLAFSPTQGDISVQADHVTLSHGATITTSTNGDGNAGNISLEAGTLRSNMSADGNPISTAAPVTIASNSTGQGKAGTITISGKAGGAADAVLLSNTKIVASVSGATIPTPKPGGGEQIDSQREGFVPMRPKADIEITAEKVALVNGTVIKADTTGGADAGSIRLNVGTLTSHAGPDGRVLISSTSDCGPGCVGGQAGDITIQGISGLTPTKTQGYVWVADSNGQPTEVFQYYLAREIDLHGTDIHSDAVGNAAGGMVLIRVQGRASFTDTNISVATQDFDINGTKPNGEFARNQGFSRIDILANDVVLKDSTIKADALVSDIGSCPLCQGGPSAGEIWLRVQNSLVADNSSITNTSRGRAQAGITKIIGDNFFSYGAVWEPDYPDHPTNVVKLTNSEVTVEALHDGLPGYLRIRGDSVILDHSILNSKVNNVTNVRDSQGRLIDVVGAGERGRVITDGRDVQGSILVSAKNLEITGGGIVAPTHGSRIGSRIELHADVLTTHQGTRPGGTLSAPRILNVDDPTRVVISTSSTGSGGAGRISFAGESVAMPEGSPLPGASSINLNNTDVLSDTRSDALGGKIELKVNGPVQLHHSTISSNVNDVRPQSANVTDQGGDITISSGGILMQSSVISTLSQGTQNGGNIAITAPGSIIVGTGSTISASNTGTANAGNIQITAGNQFTMTKSAVTTEAGEASGGSIKITTPPTGTVQLSDSIISASVLDGTGGGGSVNIDPEFVVLQNSRILANSVFGPGGNISITTNFLLPDSTSVISASSQFGQQGIISIQSPISPASGKIVPLGQKPLMPTTLLSQRCAALGGGNASSFTVAGRDSLPAEPGGWVTSPLALGVAEPEDKAVGAIGSASPDDAGDKAPLLSLRKIAPPGFLTQGFAADSPDCHS